MEKLFVLFRRWCSNRIYKNIPYECYQSELIPSNCNAIEFYVDTVSTADAFVNGRRVPIGAAWSPASNRDEIDTSTYKITWDGNVSGKMVVTRKVYQ